jgi:hypothetical protein
MSCPETVAIAIALSVTVGSFIAFVCLPPAVLSVLETSSLEVKVPSAAKRTFGANSALATCFLSFHTAVPVSLSQRYRP